METVTKYKCKKCHKPINDKQYKKLQLVGLEQPDGGIICWDCYQDSTFILL